MNTRYVLVADGGKQYKMAIGDRILLEKVELPKGKEFVIDKVMLAAQDDGSLLLGKPFLTEVQVRLVVLNQKRSKKIRIVKFKRRKGYLKRQGHRQHQTLALVRSINFADSAVEELTG